MRLSARDRSQILFPHTSTSSTMYSSQPKAWSEVIQCSFVLGSRPWEVSTQHWLGLPYSVQPLLMGNHFPLALTLGLLSTHVLLGTDDNCQLSAWTCCLLSYPSSVPCIIPSEGDCAPLLETMFGLGVLPS